MKKVNLRALGIQAMDILEMKEQNGGWGLLRSGAIVACYTFSVTAVLVGGSLAVTGGIIYGAYRLVKYTVDSAAPPRK